MAVPEKTIETVINHQFNSMIDATTSEHSVELSGFGKFLFNSKKAQRAMQKYVANKTLYENLLRTDISEQKRKTIQAKLDTANSNIAALKPKMYED